MLKVAHFQCGKCFAFYILQFLPFAFISFLFTPQPQRLIELVRVVAVEVEVGVGAAWRVGDLFGNVAPGKNVS